MIIVPRILWQKSLHITKKIPTIFWVITIFLSKAVSFPLETRDIFNLIVRYLRTNCSMYLMDIVKNSVEIVRRKRTILKGRWYQIVRLYFTYEYRGNPVGFAKLRTLLTSKGTVCRCNCTESQAATPAAAPSGTSLQELLITIVILNLLRRS